MDGTVLDTLDDLTDAINHVMEVYGHPLHTREEVRSFVGNGAVKLLQRALPEGEKDPEFEEKMACYKEYYAAHNCDKTKPYPGILELLSELKKQGIKTGIASNKHHTAVVQLYESFFKESCDCAVGNGEGRRTKPYPDSLLYVMECLGASPETTVYVGDSDVDAETAKNTGLPCILVSWGFREREKLEKLRVAAVCDTTEEVLTAIRNL